MKTRWEKRDKDERSGENENEISNEELRIQKDREFRERQLGHNNEIDMTKFRPTEFPSNKDLQTPGPSDLRTEIKIQTVKKEKNY